MTSSVRRVGVRLVLALTAGAVLVLGPSAALAQTPAAPSTMCPIMDSPVL